MPGTIEAGSSLDEDVIRLAEAIVNVQPENNVVALWKSDSDFPGNMLWHRIKKSEQVTKDGIEHSRELAKLAGQLDKLKEKAMAAFGDRAQAIQVEIAEIEQKRDEVWTQVKLSKEDDSPERLLAELMGRRGVISHEEEVGTIATLAVVRREFDALNPETRSDYTISWVV